MRLLLVLAVLLTCATAVADAYHPHVALLGGRASGLGGAAVGLPEDDAAAYYNPAAFSSDPRIELSASAQALQIKERSFSPYLGTRATESSLALVPNMSVGSSPWRGGRFAFAVFTTEAESLTLDQVLTPPAGSGIASARIRRLESSATYQIGPSYGRPINDRFSVGISAFYVYRTAALRAQEYAESSDPSAQPAAISHEADSGGVSQGLVVVGGVRLQPTGPDGRFTFGLALRSGAQLSNHLTRREERFLGTRQPDGSLLFTREPTQDSQDLRTGIPAAIAGGASGRFGRFLVTAQVTLGSALPPASSADANQQLTVNGAAGGEWHIDEHWIARMGLYSNRSSAPAVVASSSAPQLDLYGLTLGASEADGHHVTDVALQLSRMWGHAPVAAVDGTTGVAAVSGFELTLTLGGAYRF